MSSKSFPIQYSSINLSFDANKSQLLQPKPNTESIYSHTTRTYYNEKLSELLIMNYINPTFSINLCKRVLMSSVPTISVMKINSQFQNERCYMIFTPFKETVKNRIWSKSHMFTYLT
jgi:hypothetical protein